MATAIDVTSVSHSFAYAGSEMTVLDDVSLTIERGEMVCFLGPSGCGKSTLLNIIGGLLEPHRGVAKVDGRIVDGVMPKSVSFVFQESALFPWSTVWDNLMVGLEFQGVPKNERSARVAAALGAVAMSEFKSFFPDQLSGGMKQRVALARALSMQTDVLLMDEPFAALDEQTRMILGEDLSLLLSQTQKTIVMVTHSLAEAVFLSDRVFVMTSRPGRIKAVINVVRDHPRRPDFVTSPEFNAARDELYTLLHDEMRAAQAIS